MAKITLRAIKVPINSKQNTKSNSIAILLTYFLGFSYTVANKVDLEIPINYNTSLFVPVVIPYSEYDLQTAGGKTLNNITRDKIEVSILCEKSDESISIKDNTCYN